MDIEEISDKPYQVHATAKGTDAGRPDSLFQSYTQPIHVHSKPKWGNPAPLTMLGLCMSLTCISCDLLGWRGSGGGGAATTGTYIFIGGVLMVIAGVLEFFSGNTLPFVVSCGFGGFWFTMGSTLVPGFGAWAAYAENPIENPYQGLNDPSYLASFAWFFLCMALFSFISLICALNSNVPNVMCFLFLVVQYCLLCGCYWTQAKGQEALAAKVQVAAGAAGVVVVSFGWYLFAALLLKGAEAPLQLPLGDLSRFFGGKKNAVEAM